jgi:uncharacterized protein
MMRVVLDTNQYVNALLKPDSNSARIITLVHEARLVLLLSPAIVDEVRRVLTHPKVKKLHGRTLKEIESIIVEVEKIALMTPGILKVDVVKDDLSDNIFLASAVEGNADYILSGDRHLKDLRIFRGIPIMDPAAFLRRLSSQE